MPAAFSLCAYSVCARERDIETERETLLHLGSGQFFPKDPYSNSRLVLPLKDCVISYLPAVCLKALSANAAFSIAVHFRQFEP